MKARRHQLTNLRGRLLTAVSLLDANPRTPEDWRRVSDELASVQARVTQLLIHAEESYEGQGAELPPPYATSR